MKNVVLVNEENHGLICVADSLRAAYVNLINRAWIEAGTQVCVNVDTSNGEYKEEWRSLEDIMGFKNPTKAQILDFVMTVDVHSFWDGCFYFSVEPVATEREVEWEVTILYAETGDVSVKVFESKDAAFRFAAKVIAFDDCSDERVDDICCGDKHYHYTGWQPGMVMEFADENGDFAWGSCFPEWDH